MNQKQRETISLHWLAGIPFALVVHAFKMKATQKGLSKEKIESGIKFIKEVYSQNHHVETNPS